MRVEKCVECGQFMNCEEIDAHCYFEPDSEFSIERVEWTCGPCWRAASTLLEDHPGSGGEGAK